MHPLRRIYTISFLLALSIALTAYVNSTFISDIFNERVVGFFFSGAALLTILGLEYIPKALKSVGLKRTTFFILTTSTLSLLVLATSTSPIFIGVAFVLYILANNLAVFCFDIFIEHFTKEKHTGRSRGLYLTINNIGWLISPFISGVIITSLGHQPLYAIVAGVFIVILGTFVFGIRGYVDSEYRKTSPLKALSYIHKHPNLMRIIVVNFLLQFFFSWMIIFTPVYLHEIVGFSFEKIGSIFTVMLLPFVLLTFPLGALTDRAFGEKKLLFIGLIIMALATLLFGLYGGGSALVFAIILFFTRVGAATVEIMAETYFFRQVADTNPEIISLFRTTTPIAFTIGPLIGTVVLIFGNHSTLFIILTTLLLLGLIPLWQLKDLK